MEYVVILTVVALGCIAAMRALGPPLVTAFRTQVDLILLPFP